MDATTPPPSAVNEPVPATAPADKPTAKPAGTAPVERAKRPHAQPMTPEYAKQHATGIATFQAKHSISLAVVASYMSDAVRNHECFEWIVGRHLVWNGIESHDYHCAVCQRPVDTEGLTP